MRRYRINLRKFAGESLVLKVSVLEGRKVVETKTIDVPRGAQSADLLMPDGVGSARGYLERPAKTFTITTEVLDPDTGKTATICLDGVVGDLGPVELEETTR